MPRPKTPLISKRRTLEVALEIIDREGLDALSIRRLAEALDVNGASLYHHFANKDAILVGVAELALADVRAPKVHDEPWPVWMLRNTKRLRKALLAHPRLMPVILNRQPLGIGVHELEATAALLQEEGVPIGYVESLLRAGEVIAIGSVLEETMVGDSGEAALQWRDRYPLLYQSSVERALSPEELFDALSRAAINIFEQLIDADKQWTAERARALAGTVATATTNGSKQPPAKPPAKRPTKRTAKRSAAPKSAGSPASSKGKTGASVD